MAIYFIQQGQQGPIKIGKANDVKQRLVALQCGSPESLRLLGILPGDLADEGDLHQHFAHLRITGEWFQPDAELLDFIAEVADCVCDEAGLLRAQLATVVRQRDRLRQELDSTRCRAKQLLARQRVHYEDVIDIFWGKR